MQIHQYSGHADCWVCSAPSYRFDHVLFQTHELFLPVIRKAQNLWVKRGRNPLLAKGEGRVCVSTGHLLVWMMENKAILAT